MAEDDGSPRGTAALAAMSTEDLGQKMPARSFHPENNAAVVHGFGCRAICSSSSSLTLEQLDGMTQVSRAQSRATSDMSRAQSRATPDMSRAQSKPTPEVSPVLDYTAHTLISLPSLSLQHAHCDRWDTPTSPSASRSPDFVPTRAFNADSRPFVSTPLPALRLHTVDSACGMVEGPPVVNMDVTGMQYPHTVRQLRTDFSEPTSPINCMLPEQDRVVWSTVSSTASPAAIYRTDPVMTSISEDTATPLLKARTSRAAFQPLEVDPHQRLRRRTPLKENAHPVLHLSHEEIKLNAVPQDLGLGVRMPCRAESPAVEAPAVEAPAVEAPLQPVLRGSLLTNLSPSPGSLAKSRALYVSKRIFKGHLKSDFEPSTQPVQDKSAHPRQTQVSQYSLQEIPAFLKNDVVSGRRIRYTAPVLTTAHVAKAADGLAASYEPLVSPRVSRRPSVAAACESPEENVPSRRPTAQKTTRCNHRPSLRRSSAKVRESTRGEQLGTASSREYVTTQRISRQFGDSTARSTLPNLAEGAPITSLSARVSLRSPSPRLEQPSIGKLSGNPLFAVFNE
ncbi:MAG: uncharacterized protein KVP18_000391 [Porospora cf. gigantea A]|uniref:uncharacterized protein n=1 Tax=Porospora cf. gigantea A TaxID=2853593 RepID=UPI00355A76D2|nr:MAG: hypothetical protein KVP18_000391 [Porospora cf. gigantea A]